MKKAILTVLIGDYESLKPAPEYKGWDSILITNQVLSDYKGWQVIHIPISNNPKLDSRRYKILSHKYLPEYGLVCYIDASVTLLKEPPSKNQYDLSTHQESHLMRRRMRWLDTEKDNHRNVYEQKKFYRKEKFTQTKRGCFKMDFL